MHRVTLTIFVIILLASLGTYGHAMDSPEQAAVNLSAMTVAELDKAGDAARAQKNYDLAIQYFEAALKKERKNAAIYNKLGLSQLKKDDLKGARNSFEKAAKYNSKYAEAINNIGAIEYMKKNYGGAAKYFKKAVALDETHSTYHVNLGAAWFSQKKLDRAIAEYIRAMELDPDAFRQESRIGIAAQISSPEERAQYAYALAKAYAKRGDTEGCLECLKKAKEQGYRNLANVYKDEEFSRMRENPRLQEVVPPPAAK
ncbi:MAG TPA: tetratricopeptide repeat protein [Candidatus Sulfotelmatobacter sp.]|nr:tetratricopeptide repeat protein [Candidatus Sulfotelmatobacter sp.]